MTAEAMQGDRERCLEAGMNDYVTKPIRIEELVAAIGRAPRRGGRPRRRRCVFDERVVQRLAEAWGATRRSSPTDRAVPDRCARAGRRRPRGCRVRGRRRGPSCAAHPQIERGDVRRDGPGRSSRELEEAAKGGSLDGVALSSGRDL